MFGTTGWMIEGRTDAPVCSRVTLILHFSHTSTHVCQRCGSRLILVECLCDREREEATSDLVSGIRLVFGTKTQIPLVCMVCVLGNILFSDRIN